MAEEASLGLKASQGDSGQMIEIISPFKYGQRKICMVLFFCLFV